MTDFNLSRMPITHPLHPMNPLGPNSIWPDGEPGPTVAATTKPSEPIRVEISADDAIAFILTFGLLLIAGIIAARGIAR